MLSQFLTVFTVAGMSGLLAAVRGEIPQHDVQQAKPGRPESAR